MYQKQISALIGEISSLATEVNLSKKAIVFVDCQGHVDLIRVQIADKDDWKKKTFDAEVWFEGVSFNLDRPRYEAEAIEKLNGIKSELEHYINESSFNQIWSKFQNEIEKEILSCLKSGFNYDVETLFFDVEMETKSTPLTLNDIYETIKLTNGEATAKFFKAEMQDNIEWLDNMINWNWSEYEKEDAV